MPRGPVIDGGGEALTGRRARGWRRIRRRRSGAASPRAVPRGGSGPASSSGSSHAIGQRRARDREIGPRRRRRAPTASGCDNPGSRDRRGSRRTARPRSRPRWRSARPLAALLPGRGRARSGDARSRGWPAAEPTGSFPAAATAAAGPANPRRRPRSEGARRNRPSTCVRWRRARVASTSRSGARAVCRCARGSGRRDIDRRRGRPPRARGRRLRARRRRRGRCPSQGMPTSWGSPRRVCEVGRDDVWSRSSSHARIP